MAANTPGTGGGDPFPIAKQHVQEQVNKLQQDYSRWTAMALSNPGKLGLADRMSTALRTLMRTLHTMDKSVDKAEQDPERYNVTIPELHTRRQWIQDTRAHTKQMQQSIESVEQGFTAVAIPGNAEMQGEVDEAGQHQQLTLAQQDMALDKIQQAAARVADLGLGMMHELREQEPLIESLDRDTEGVSNRMSASMHKLQEVIKKMNFCTQMGVIIVLMIVLIIMVYFTAFRNG
eukprot:jgi/Ulvmu1/2207/UM013_0053.1